MPDTKISALTDGATAAATDRLPVARSPFGAGDNRYVTPAYIRTYILGLASAFAANGAASTPAISLTGTILTGGTGTTNFPHVFVQPTGATASTTWSTAGTLYGGNAETGFTGNFLDFRLAGAARFKVSSTGIVTASDGSAGAPGVSFVGSASIGIGRVGGSLFFNDDTLRFAGAAILNFGGYGAVNWYTGGAYASIGVKLTPSLAMLSLEGASAGAALQLIEQTAPSAGATNSVRVYAEDNGAGKTRLMAIFATGAAQQIAIEP